MTTRGYNNKALTTNIFSMNVQVLLASSQLVLGSRNYDTKIVICESGSGQISAPHMKLSSGKGGGPGETIAWSFPEGLCVSHQRLNSFLFCFVSFFCLCIRCRVGRLKGNGLQNGMILISGTLHG